ncbi:hypothetical protein [Desulfobulbus sp.]|uniref:hypothetical protein n=1 Tax=Desulfobulbus sp. TaxID=895 RepID=UPI00286F12D2|nr:hypothetical protein [Desulfobulbus sp.]
MGQNDCWPARLPALHEYVSERATFKIFPERSYRRWLACRAYASEVAVNFACTAFFSLLPLTGPADCGFAPSPEKNIGCLG